MSKLHTRYGVVVELLSPLHIGTGRELRLDYDLVAYDGRTYRVDEEALLEQALAEAEAAGAAELNRLLSGRPAPELLSPQDYADPVGRLFRYVMPGTPSATRTGAKVFEQIKDVHDRLYLPGSSLKGALRTVLAWGIYTHQKRKPDLNRLGRGRSWVAQPLERELFGADPNHDWLRALRVEDSRPIDAAGRLSLYPVRVYPTEARGGSGLDIDVEAVRPGTKFASAISVDEYGFGARAAKQLGWEGRRRWIEGLPRLAKGHARQRLLTEAEYFKAKGSPDAARRFYHRLIEQWDGLGDDELIVQIGWGAGWESKTLGSDLIRQDDETFERLLREYRMTKERDRRPGDPFPRSRHLTLRGGQPTEPLGWVHMRLKEAGDGGLE